MCVLNVICFETVIFRRTQMCMFMCEPGLVFVLCIPCKLLKITLRMYHTCVTCDRWFK
jgi:hypothetical protein